MRNSDPPIGVLVFAFLLLLLQVAGYAAVGYVAYHFITKLW